MSDNTNSKNTAQGWRDYIAAGRRADYRPVANNTTVRITPEGLIAIELHSTDIVTIFKDGRMILNSGGWRTVTTKERINRFTPAGISQRAGVWYMRDGSLFYDGMVIGADGTPKQPRKTAKYEQRLKAIKKQARAYAKDFVKAIEAGDVGYPNAGDCWYCLMFDNAGGADTKVMSKSVGAQHIRDHIKERYYVPSLLVNAGRAAGYRDNQIGYMGLGNEPGRRLLIDPENIIYKYIVKRLQEDL